MRYSRPSPSGERDLSRYLLQYCYVVGSGGRLLGVVRTRNLVAAGPGAEIRGLMTRPTAVNAEAGLATRHRAPAWVSETSPNSMRIRLAEPRCGLDTLEVDPTFPRAEADVGLPTP